MRSWKVKLRTFRSLFIVLLLLNGYFFFFYYDSPENEEGNIYDGELSSTERLSIKNIFAMVKLKIRLVPGSFLVNTPNCKIPNANPFAKEAMKIFKREKYEPCSKKRPLTSVDQSSKNDTATLMIHDEFKNDFLSWWQNDLKVNKLQVTQISTFS